MHIGCIFTGNTCPQNNDLQTRYPEQLNMYVNNTFKEENNLS